MDNFYLFALLKLTQTLTNLNKDVILLPFLELMDNLYLLAHPLKD